MTNKRRYQDHFGRRAKAEGHAARSVYKLEEIDNRWHLLGLGQTVLDLGCAPGSWLKFAAERVGEHGRVVGYDLKPVEITLPKNATAHVGDAFAIDVGDIRCHVVLSDMAPSTIGHRQTDALRSAALAERALDVADRVLLKDGHVVIKVLEGGDVPLIVKRMRGVYTKVERLRPEATRKESTELFLIGLRKLS